MEQWPANTRLQSKILSRKPHKTLYGISKRRRKTWTGRFVPGNDIVTKLRGQHGGFGRNGKHPDQETTWPESTKQEHLSAKNIICKALASLKH
jgi:hypothetical protein